MIKIKNSYHFQFHEHYKTLHINISYTYLIYNVLILRREFSNMGEERYV